MNTPPPDIAGSTIVSALREGWRLDVVALSYIPKGFGSHHWEAVMPDGARRFVTVDDLDAKPWFGSERQLALAGLRAALATARELGTRCALPFVVAPEPTSDGEALRRLTDRYTVSVFPWVEGQAGRWGDRLTEAQHAVVLGLLADLHAATVPATTPVVGFELPGRDALEAALDEADRPWTGGPFSKSARAHFAARHGDLRAALAHLDELSAEARDREPVPTHGEPHPGNLIWNGIHPALVDWDTIGLAPRERDLWMLDGGPDGLAAYRARTGADIGAAALSFFRLRWLLADIAGFAAMFRSPHDRTADTEKAWNGLVANLGAAGPLVRPPPWTLGGLRT